MEENLSLIENYFKLFKKFYPIENSCLDSLLSDLKYIYSKGFKNIVITGYHSTILIFVYKILNNRNLINNLKKIPFPTSTYDTDILVRKEDLPKNLKLDKKYLLIKSKAKMGLNNCIHDVEEKYLPYEVYKLKNGVKYIDVFIDKIGPIKINFNKDLIKISEGLYVLKPEIQFALLVNLSALTERRVLKGQLLWQIMNDQEREQAIQLTIKYSKLFLEFAGSSKYDLIKEYIKSSNSILYGTLIPSRRLKTDPNYYKALKEVCKEVLKYVKNTKEYQIIYSF